MATTSQTLHRNLLAANDAGSLMAAKLDTDAVIQTNNQLLEITQVLQTTLDVKQLLTLFSHEVRRHVPHSGLSYRNDSPAFDMIVGCSTRQSCEYSLVIGDNKLGFLTFMRKRKFSEEETNELENLLCVLMYPLRNALHYERAIQSAHTDPLTGLCNRAAMDMALKREFDLARRQGTQLSLLMVDIDHFKDINDQYGHASGDCVLRAVAERMGENIRSTDIVFRYGGEEFLVLLSNTGTEGTALLGERLRSALANKPCACGDDDISVTISLGGATLQADESLKTLFKRTDDCLYEAKNAGRNQVRISKV